MKSLPLRAPLHFEAADNSRLLGNDLLYKLQRSPFLEPVWMVGIDPTSDGLKRAAEMGLKVTSDGVDGLLPHVKEDGIQIAFDATSAYVHAENSRKLNALGVLMIDLTPAAIGPYCVPPVNLLAHLGQREMNVNMVTCGGQATIPMVAAVSRVQPVAYGEIVATVSSRSVGPGTRKNIDEFTRTTAGAVEKVVVANFEQLLMTGLLQAQPTAYLELLRSPVRTVMPRHVRIAEEFIRANAHKPLCIEDLTRVTGVCGRTLYSGFQRFLGKSPMQYLRDARMDNVRRDMETAPPALTVTDIATKWGFYQLGRFAIEYRNRFGESPSATRRRAG